MSILTRLRRRLGRGGTDARVTESLVEILRSRGVSAQVVAESRAVTQSLSFAAGSRVLSVIELGESESPLRYVIVSRIGGQAAGHMGRVTVTGVHVTLDRSELGERLPSDWSTSIQAQRREPRGGLGVSREFDWRALDSTAAGVDELIASWSTDDRVSRWASVILSQPGLLQLEIAPSHAVVRVAAHQTGDETPSGTVVEAVLNLARALVRS